MSDREYIEDKVYLKLPNGEIWPYDPYLAKIRGTESVIPNPSKKEEGSEVDTDTSNTGDGNVGGEGDGTSNTEETDSNNSGDE